MILLILEILMLCLVGFPLIYLAALSLLALFAHERVEFPATRLHRFAFVVPAHDEELSIERTVQSLLNVNYPREAFDVIVVADNCTDRTAPLARALGATVYERSHPVERSKGHALRWAFDRLLPLQPAYDAFVVIDADSVVVENYLTVMNFYLGHGARAIQCSDLAAPQPGSWSAEITRLGFTLYNYVRPMARKLLGGSAGIRGNGMCFAASLLPEIPWSTYSLNEDLEYGLILLLQGVRVTFAPEARVLATMPARAEDARSQRERWESGRFPIIRTYGTKLIVYALRHRSFAAFDAWIDLLTPAFVNLFGIAAFVFCAHLLLGLFGWRHGTYVILWGCITLAGLGHVILGLVAARADAGLFRAFFFIPKYALWKLLLYLKILRRGSQADWIRTARDPALRADRR